MQTPDGAPLVRVASHIGSAFERAVGVSVHQALCQLPSGARRGGDGRWYASSWVPESEIGQLTDGWVERTTFATPDVLAGEAIEVGADGFTVKPVGFTLDVSRIRGADGTIKRVVWRPVSAAYGKALDTLRRLLDELDGSEVWVARVGSGLEADPRLTRVPNGREFLQRLDLAHPVSLGRLRAKLPGEERASEVEVLLPAGSSPSGRAPATRRGLERRAIDAAMAELRPRWEAKDYPGVGDFNMAVWQLVEERMPGLIDRADAADKDSALVQRSKRYRGGRESWPSGESAAWPSGETAAQDFPPVSG